VATTYELGWHYHTSHGGFDASADAYRTDVRDDIFFMASTVTGGYFQNIGATRRQGLELALQWLGPTGARVYANYGYTRATFETTARLATTRDSAGETVTPGDVLPMVPDSRINAGLVLPLVAPHGVASGPSLLAGLDARYVGRQWVRGDEENATSRLSAYAVADLSLTLAWRELELRGTVGNLLARRYYSFGTFAQNPTAPGRPVERWLTPGPPRHVQVSLSTDF
jgi:outer membrane receptor protein involved in Fe transport